ncbi:hypothetical protein JCM5350_008286 [Sporobolomyces pararoseus]
MFGKVLDPSCFSGTFFEYCASSKETCCGICTVVPIAYPGTLIAWTLGSFCNLLYALIFRAEAPYNLLFQFLSVDAALISLIDRYFESTNRIDLFDYCFVPMSICSSIPIAVAIALSRIEDFHVIGPGASLQLRKKSHQLSAFETGDEVDSYVKRELKEMDRQHQRRLGNVGQGGSRSRRMSSLSRSEKKDPHKADLATINARFGTGSTKPKKPRAGSNVSHDGYSGLPAAKSVVISEHGKDPLHPDVFATVPHPKLPEKLVWFYFGHLTVFTLVFIVLYTTVKNTSQENCNDQFDINSFWRPVMGGLTAFWLLIGWFFCYLMHENVKHYHDPTHDFHRVVSLSGVLSLLHMTGNDKTARLRNFSTKHEKIARTAICLTVYGLWAGPYLTVWFKAVNEFMLLGPNPWPFEQVGAATSIFIPFLIVWRGVVDRKFVLACKDADEKQAERQRIEEGGDLPVDDEKDNNAQDAGQLSQGTRDVGERGRTRGRSAASNRRNSTSRV